MGKQQSRITDEGMPQNLTARDGKAAPMTLAKPRALAVKRDEPLR
jgi:hypothetical protein